LAALCATPAFAGSKPRLEPTPAASAAEIPPLADLLDKARGDGVDDTLAGIEQSLPGFRILGPVGPPRMLLRDRESERPHHVIDESGGPPLRRDGHRLWGMDRRAQA